MPLKSLSYQPEIAEMFSKNHRDKHRFRKGLWKCSGVCAHGDWGIDADRKGSCRGSSMVALHGQDCRLEDPREMDICVRLVQPGILLNRCPNLVLASLSVCLCPSDSPVCLTRVVCKTSKNESSEGTVCPYDVGKCSF